MRFEVTGVLDAIELRLTTDVVLAQAVVDVGELAWFVDLDRGRPVSLLRIGLVVDALGRHLSQGAVMIYPVVGRPLISDQDLTSKERMVLGRWADDAQIDVVPDARERALEVADLTGLPLLTRGGLEDYADRYGWLRTRPDRVLTIVPRDGGAALLGPVPAPVVADGPGAALLARSWRCSDVHCAQFGERRAGVRAVPRLRAGVPVCPRHQEPLTQAGASPAALPIAVVIDGMIRDRFVIRADRPRVVGRRPDGDDQAISLNPWLEGEAARWVSRRHLSLELDEAGLRVTDTSMNGTVILVRPALHAPAERVELGSGQSHLLGRWDTVELHDGVELGPVDGFVAPEPRELGSVMAEAPTVAIRSPLVR